MRVEAEGVPPVLTGLDGFYRLYGVPGHAGMRISKKPPGQMVLVQHWFEELRRLVPTK